MASATSVKIKKEKVIEALKSKLDADASTKAHNELLKKEYDETLLKWQTNLLKEYASQLELDSVSTRWNGQIEVTYKKLVDFNIPNQPEKPDYLKDLGSYEIEELQSTIRLLGMADDEYVNASTMKSISKYL